MSEATDEWLMAVFNLADAVESYLFHMEKGDHLSSPAYDHMKRCMDIYYETD